MMTSYLPALPEGPGPIYVRLADRIERDIAAGALPAGAKLPPQRNLAFDIGVTIGTVGRAYTLVRERGLVSGEIGRGTYVLARKDAEQGAPIAQSAEFFGSTRPLPATGALRLDSTAAPDVGQMRLIEAMTATVAREHCAESLNYVRAPSASWLQAGAQWLGFGDWAPETDCIVPTLGAHAGILAVLAAMTAAGDRIVFESLTYSSVARSAALIGRRPIAIDCDDQGIRPEDFEHLCAQQHPKAAFLMPDLQNPTLTTLPEARRQAIAEIARKHNVWLIEDAIYGALMNARQAPLAAIAPERTFHVGGLSKTVAVGIRAGWVACPPHMAARVQTANRMLSGGKPFLLAELAARLVLSGDAQAIREKVCAEIAARHALARTAFDGLDFVSSPSAPFLWMKLPEPWLSGIFKNAAAKEAVLIDEEDEFKPGRMERTFHRVRVAYSLPGTRDEVANGFETVRRLLEGGAAGYDNYD